MYVIVAGGGKVGSNVTRTLLDLGHEVTLIEQRPDRFARLEEEFGPTVIRGDATEIAVLERAGIARPPELLLAVTGDDEDNLVISQIAKEAYGVRTAIARVNDPRNQQHFDLLGITQTLCATTSILGLVEHEVPEHGLVQLLQLQKEGLVVVEVQVEGGSPAAGKKAGGLQIPEGSRLISVFNQGRTELVEPSTVLRPGDQVLAVVPTNAAADLRRALLEESGRGRTAGGLTADLGVPAGPDRSSWSLRPCSGPAIRCSRSCPPPRLRICVALSSALRGSSSEAPVVARHQNHHGDDLEPADPHQADHRHFRHVAELGERSVRPGDPESGSRRFQGSSQTRRESRAFRDRRRRWPNRSQ